MMTKYEGYKRSVVLLYPFLFEPILKERIWGGQKLGQLFDRRLPGDKIGESWDKN